MVIGQRNTSWQRVLGFAFILSSFSASQISAQASQALRGLNEPRLLDREVDSLVVIVRAARLEAARMVSEPSLRTAANGPQAVAALLLLIKDAEAALDARDDVEEFVERYEAFQASANDATDALVTMGAGGENLQEQLTFVATSIPTHLLVSDVVFTPGFGYNINPRVAGTGTVTLSSNLLGAGLGVAFKALGSSSLEQFFMDNLSVGATLPTGDDHFQVSNDLGVGMGQVNLGKRLRSVSIWPVFGFRQLDSDDPRLPRSVAAGSAATSFSQPYFGIAFFPTGVANATKAIKCGRLTPIVTAGVTFPFYNTGNTFDALADLFTAKVNEFDESGNVGFEFGVALPLLPIKKAMEVDPKDCQ